MHCSEDSKVFQGLYPLDMYSVTKQGCSGSLGFPEVQDEFIGLRGVQSEVDHSTPLNQAQDRSSLTDNHLSDVCNIQPDFNAHFETQQGLNLSHCTNTNQSTKETNPKTTVNILFLSSLFDSWTKML